MKKKNNLLCLIIKRGINIIKMIKDLETGCGRGEYNHVLKKK